MVSAKAMLHLSGSPRKKLEAKAEDRKDLDPEGLCFSMKLPIARELA